ncbi:MAG: hypothetical protein IT462_16165 [Planctomycetes bacterium]|nr:hypothetical protein [Planctomycetota bacterium]
MLRLLAPLLLVVLAGSMAAQRPAKASSVDEINKLPADTKALILSKASDEMVAALERLAKLEDLSFERDKATVTDAGLAPIAKLANLRSLWINVTVLGDGCFEHLGKCPALEKFSFMYNQKVTDAGLRKLSTLRALRELDLSDCTLVTGEFLADFSDKLPLTALTCPSCGKFGAAGYKAVGRFTSLESLTLGATAVTVEGLAALAGLQKLKALGIGGDGLDDAGCAEIAKLSALETLIIGQGKITDEGGKHLAKLKNLKKLRAMFFPLGDGTLEAFKGHDKLVTLLTSGAKFTAAGLSHLKTMTALEEVDLRSCQLGAEGCKALAESKSIKRLSLSETGIGDDAMEHVAKMTQLTHLLLIQNKLTPAGAMKLVTLNGLKELNLRRNSAITVDDIKELIEKLPDTKIQAEFPTGG